MQRFFGHFTHNFGHYAPPPVAPNYEVLPVFNAGIYDLNAQFLLRGGIPRRRDSSQAILFLLLAVFHTLAGQDYEPHHFRTNPAAGLDSCGLI
jgi:hypothetical protein